MADYDFSGNIDDQAYYRLGSGFNGGTGEFYTGYPYANNWGDRGPWMSDTGVGYAGPFGYSTEHVGIGPAYGRAGSGMGQGQQNFGYADRGPGNGGFVHTPDYDDRVYATAPDAWPGQLHNHAGIGPRGYQRSDERIHEEVNERLTAAPDLDATDIDVRVENGDVTLTGVVDDRHAKHLAEDLANDVSGVNDVHNELKVRHGFLAGLMGEKAD